MAEDWLCHECKKKPDAPHRSWCSRAEPTPPQNAPYQQEGSS